MLQRTLFAAIAGFGAAALGGAALAQSSLPDLVVNTDILPDGTGRTVIMSTSCVEREPLAVVRVAVDNIGEGAARDPNFATVGLKNVVSAYAEHAPYTRPTAWLGDDSANDIDPHEIHTFEFRVGEKVQKKDRIGVAVSRSRGAPRRFSDQQNLPRSQRLAIQTALTKLGFDTNGIDAMFGPATHRAIKAFQQSIDQRRSGVLTSSQLDVLARASGETGVQMTEAVGDREFKIVVIVDPENRITEANEDNNVWVSPPQVIDCN